MENPPTENLKGKTTSKLMQMIPFTESDLTMNRNFTLSDSQKARIKPKVDLYLYLSGFSAAIFLFLLPVFAYHGFGSLLLLIFLGSGFLISLIGFIWSFRLKKQLDKNQGIKIVAGEADFDVSYEGDNSDIPVYFLTIKEVKFYLSEEIYHAFLGKRFRIYYFQILRNEILSVEVFD
jgi:hypothetical protein